MIVEKKDIVINLTQDKLIISNLQDYDFLKRSLFECVCNAVDLYFGLELDKDV